MPSTAVSEAISFGLWMLIRSETRAAAVNLCLWTWNFMLLSAYTEKLYLHMVTTGTESYFRMAVTFQEGFKILSSKYFTQVLLNLRPAGIARWSSGILWCLVTDATWMWVRERKQTGTSHLLCEGDLKQNLPIGFSATCISVYPERQHSTGKIGLLPEIQLRSSSPAVQWSRSYPHLEVTLNF